MSVIAETAVHGQGHKQVAHCGELLRTSSRRQPSLVGPTKMGQWTSMTRCAAKTDAGLVFILQKWANIRDWGRGQVINSYLNAGPCFVTADWRPAVPC